MALGIFDSQECATALEKFDVLDNENVGRLLFSLTDGLKAELAEFLEKNFPPKASSIEKRNVFQSKQYQSPAMHRRRQSNPMWHRQTRAVQKQKKQIVEDEIETDSETSSSMNLRERLEAEYADLYLPT